MRITKEQLEKKYRKMKNKDLCKELGISNGTLLSYLFTFGIEKKGKGNRNSKMKIQLIV